MSEAHDNHVLGGYKATLSNPNTGEEAKEHAKQVLADAGVSTTGNTSGSHGSTGDEHENRVLGGHKATLNNPNTSEEAKEHAKQVLADAGVSAGNTGSTGTNETSTHDKNVLAGYKGVLARDNVSDEAKEKAERILKEAGEL
ncbi:hypothetical protein BDV93DRAFT_518900 [Ceratobasidium sp. AG-I]|nr:hypothetical protein BDV93DRAFT_518900 [Ceratobasidium sp. AG-I]